MAFSYTIDPSGIKYINIPSSGLKGLNYKPRYANNNFEYADQDGIKTFINAVELNWNGAQLKNGSTVKATLNTTGEMLSILQTAYNYATTYTGTTSLTSSSVLGTINGQSLKYGGSINIEVGSQLTGATTTVLGGIKTKYHKTGNATIVDTSSSTVTNRNYGVETDGTYLAFVNVPWTDTDTKVTSAANHYTPTTDSNSALSASASNGTAAWGTQVVKGVTVSRDTKGHITGISVQSAAIPAQPTSVTGNAGTATKLATARTLTIGSTGKTFDGSANVNWTLTEIGAAAAGHTHTEYITESKLASKSYITTSVADERYATKNHQHTQYAPIEHAHSNYAPKSHASTATTYGVGTDANYGHLKISGAYTTKTSAKDIALSLGAAYNLYTAFVTRINDLTAKIESLTTRVETLEGFHTIKPVTDVTVKPKTYTLYGKGNTAQLTYSILPTDASNKTVTWNSSAAGIATVNGEGKVKTVSKGSATITATANDGSGISDTCAVTVSEARITGISVNTNYIEAEYGGIISSRFDTRQTIKPGDGLVFNEGFTYTITRGGGATIDSRTGEISIAYVGETYFNISSNADSTYYVEVSVNITKGNQTLSANQTTLSWGASDALSAKTVTISGNKTQLSVSSSNPNINATISGTTVTITPTSRGIINAKVTISASETDKYKASSVYITVNVPEWVQYYWYAGQTNPANNSRITSTVGAEGWRLISNPNTVSQSNPLFDTTTTSDDRIVGTSSNYWFIALPADKLYKIYDSDYEDQIAVGNFEKQSSTVSFKGVNYNVYKGVGTSRNFDGYTIY